MNTGRVLMFAAGVLLASPAIVQCQATYGGANVTGLFVLSGTENAMALARADAGLGSMTAFLAPRAAVARFKPLAAFSKEFPAEMPKYARQNDLLGFHRMLMRSLQLAPHSLVASPVDALTIVNGGGADFNGLTQEDQRDANAGNQFTVEPPSPSIAVSGNYVLEGVNNAIQVYDTSGKPLLPAVIATNELFGLPPAYNRTTGISGPYPTDMRVFFDQDIQRWFVLQRAQDEDQNGNNLASSHIYLAVSQTADPTGTYNIYIADTTDARNISCPCVDDYPQIGADKYGFYISSDELGSFSGSFADVSIVGLSKASLAAGAATPTTVQFILQFNSGYEFAIVPATTPPGASPFIASGGVEYLASSIFESDEGSAVAVWALSNTSSLATAAPNVTLQEVIVPTISYQQPFAAIQKNGPLPYGSSLSPPGPVAQLDGSDARILSLVYAGARLYLTLGTQVHDQNAQLQDGGVFAVLVPSFRSGILSAFAVDQHYLIVNGNSLLRPAVAVNHLGQGAIAATLVGPNLYPSAVYIPVSASTTPSTVYVAGAGAAPEDGFTGYTGGLGAGTARWGDYSTAVATADGSIWMVAEYIGNLPRTTAANWDTLVMHMKP